MLIDEKFENINEIEDRIDFYIRETTKELDILEEGRRKKDILLIDSCLLKIVDISFKIKKLGYCWKIEKHKEISEKETSSFKKIKGYLLKKEIDINYKILMSTNEEIFKSSKRQLERKELSLYEIIIGDLIYPKYLFLSIIPGFISLFVKM
jgi:hypothetical protein